MSVGPLNFERFTDVHRRLSASLTIRQNGQLMLNEDARSEYGLHQYQFVILFFDRVQRAIGIRFTNDKTEDGALHLLSGSHNSYVNARTFFEKFFKSITAKPTNLIWSQWGNFWWPSFMIATSSIPNASSPKT